jgi:hypothetical protein
MRPASDTDVVIKAYKNPFYIIDDKINKFKTNFMKLEDALDRGTAFLIKLPVFRVLDKVEDIDNKVEDDGKCYEGQSSFSYTDLV